MKSDMLEVLLYLFTHALDGRIDLTTEHEQGSLIIELQAAGFNREQIADAFDWLLSLTKTSSDGESLTLQTDGVRIYNSFEQSKFSIESRGLLLTLEQTGLLSPTMREEVLERALYLDVPEIKPEHMNWLILSVIYKDAGYKDAQLWLQDFNAKQAQKLH